MGLVCRFLGSDRHDVRVCHGKPPYPTVKIGLAMASPYAIRFCDENSQNNPVHGVSEAKMSGSPPSDWQNTRYFYPILLF